MSTEIDEMSQNELTEEEEKHDEPSKQKSILTFFKPKARKEKIGNDQARKVNMKLAEEDKVKIKANLHSNPANEEEDKQQHKKNRDVNICGTESVADNAKTAEKENEKRTKSCGDITSLENQKETEKQVPIFEEQIYHPNNEKLPELQNEDLQEDRDLIRRKTLRKKTRVIACSSSDSSDFEASVKKRKIRKKKKRKTKDISTSSDEERLLQNSDQLNGVGDSDKKSLTGNACISKDDYHPVRHTIEGTIIDESFTAATNVILSAVPAKIEKEFDSLDESDKNGPSVQGVTLLSKAISIDEEIDINVDQTTPRKNECPSSTSKSSCHLDARIIFKTIIPAQQSPLKPEVTHSVFDNAVDNHKMKNVQIMKLNRQQPACKEQIIIQAATSAPIPIFSHIFQRTAAEEQWYQKLSKCTNLQKYSLKHPSGFKVSFTQLHVTGFCRSLLDLEKDSSRKTKSFIHQKTISECLESICIATSESFVLKTFQSFLNCQMNILKQCVAKAEQSKANMKIIWDKDEKIKPVIFVNSSPEKKAPVIEEPKNDIRKMFGKSKKKNRFEKKVCDHKKVDEEASRTDEKNFEGDCDKRKVGKIKGKNVVKADEMEWAAVKKKKKKRQKKKEEKKAARNEDRECDVQETQIASESESKNVGIVASFKKVSRRSKNLLVSECDKKIKDDILSSSVIEITGKDAETGNNDESKNTSIEASFKKVSKRSKKHVARNSAKDVKTNTICYSNVEIDGEEASSRLGERKSLRRKTRSKVLNENNEIYEEDKVDNSDCCENNFTDTDMEKTGKKDVERNEASKKNGAKKRNAKKKTKKNKDRESIDGKRFENTRKSHKKSRMKANKDSMEAIESRESNVADLDLPSDREDVSGSSKRKSKKLKKKAKKKDQAEQGDSIKASHDEEDDIAVEKKEATITIDIRTMFGKKKSVTNKAVNERVSAGEKTEFLEIFSSPECSTDKQKPTTEQAEKHDVEEMKEDKKIDIRMLFKLGKDSSPKLNISEESSKKESDDVAELSRNGGEISQIDEVIQSSASKKPSSEMSLGGNDNEQSGERSPIEQAVSEVTLNLSSSENRNCVEELQLSKTSITTDVAATDSSSKTEDCMEHKVRNKSILSFLKPVAGKQNTKLTSAKDSSEDCVDKATANDTGPVIEEAENPRAESVENHLVAKKLTNCKQQQLKENVEVVDSTENTEDSALVGADSDAGKEQRCHLKRKRMSNITQDLVDNTMMQNPPLSPSIRHSKRKKFNDEIVCESKVNAQSEKVSADEEEGGEEANNGKNYGINDRTILKIPESSNACTSTDGGDLDTYGTIEDEKIKRIKPDVKDASCSSHLSLPDDEAVIKIEVPTKRVTRKRQTIKQCEIEEDKDRVRGEERADCDGERNLTREGEEKLMNAEMEMENDSEEDDPVMEIHQKNISDSCSPDKKSTVNDCGVGVEQAPVNVNDCGVEMEETAVIVNKKSCLLSKDRALGAPCFLQRPVEDIKLSVAEGGRHERNAPTVEVLAHQVKSKDLGLVNKDELTEVVEAVHVNIADKDLSLEDCQGKHPCDLTEPSSIETTQNAQEVVDEAVDDPTSDNEKHVGDSKRSKRKRTKSIVDVDSPDDATHGSTRRRSRRVKEKEERVKEVESKVSDVAAANLSPEKKRRKKSRKLSETVEEPTVEEPTVEEPMVEDLSRSVTISDEVLPKEIPEAAKDVASNQRLPRCFEPSSSRTIIKEEPVTEEIVNSYLQWTEKYSPIKHSDVIGNKEAVEELFVWLSSWKEKHEYFARMMSMNASKRIQCKNSNGIESDSDFENSSDEESSLSNTFLIIGKTGCGSTTAVYACAQELGYKVLELNPSIYRTGKQIQSLLGEATQSHQVKRKFHGAAADDVDNKADDLKGMKSLSSFFGGKPGKPDEEGEDDEGTSAKENCGPVQAADDMSVILLEQADIVFEDLDKGFWLGVNELRNQTKRPIVITANDASVAAQLDGNYAEIVTMNYAKKKEALVRLQLMCLAEHVLPSMELVDRIFTASNGDVRQSALQLQFWLDHWKDPLYKVMDCGWEKQYKLVNGILCQADQDLVRVENASKIEQTEDIKQIGANNAHFKNKSNVLQKQVVDVCDQVDDSCTVVDVIDSSLGIDRDKDQGREGSPKIENISDVAKVAKTEGAILKVDALAWEGRESVEKHENHKDSTMILESTDIKRETEDVEPGFVAEVSGHGGVEALLIDEDEKTNDKGAGKSLNETLIHVVGTEDVYFDQSVSYFVNVDELDMAKVFQKTSSTVTSPYVPVEKQKKNQATNCRRSNTDLDNIAASCEDLSRINTYDRSQRISNEVGWWHCKLKDGLSDYLPLDVNRQQCAVLEGWYAETREVTKQIQNRSFKMAALEEPNAISTEHNSDICSLFASTERCFPLTSKLDHRAIAMDIFPSLKSICLLEETRKMSQFKRRTRRFLHYLDGILLHVDTELKKELVKNCLM